MSAFANSQRLGSLHPPSRQQLLPNDPHLEKLGNNYKKGDPFTLVNRVRPSQPLLCAHRQQLARLPHSKIIIPRCVAAQTRYISQMRAGKISPIVATLTKSIFVTKLIHPESRRSRAANSPKLNNSLLAQARRVCKTL